MAQPAEVEAIRDDLLDAYTQVWRDIEQRLFDLARHPPERTAVLRRRLTELSRDIGAEMGGLDRQMRTWLQQQFPDIYRVGGVDAASSIGERFAWAQHDRAAVQLLARRTFDDLLTATKFVRADTKRFVRDAAHRAALRSIAGGDTAAQAGRDLATTLRGVFGTDPIAAVRYANGARHSLADYADTVLRTTTATAYNQGALNGAPEVEWWEVFDGPDCGWTAHDDTDLANGTVRPADECQRQMIAHPRCARSFGPRPDIGDARAARGADRFSPEERQQLAADERARAAAQPVRLSRAAEQRRQATIDRRAARLAR